MTMVNFKDPNAALDYENDWSDWLDEDTISSSDWIVPDGITVDSSSNTTTTTTVFLSGGTAGETYRIINRIETAGERIDDRSRFIKIKER